MELIYEPLHTSSEQKIIQELYEDAFPKDERREFEEILQLARMEELSVWDIRYNERSIGIISVWIFKGFAYIEHFAIDKTWRGKGFGTCVFRDIYRLFQGKIILEVEPPSNEKAKQRIRFYEQSGMTMTDYVYIQPPYSPKQNPVPLKIMVGKEMPANTNQLKPFIEQILKRVYRVNI